MHNGAVEDGVKMAAAAKATQLVLNDEPDVVPVVAFKDRRSLRALSGLEEIQTQQRAGEKCSGGQNVADSKEVARNKYFT